jgi:hypothetical protein
MDSFRHSPSTEDVEHEDARLGEIPALLPQRAHRPPMTSIFNLEELKPEALHAVIKQLSSCPTLGWPWAIHWRSQFTLLRH